MQHELPFAEPDKKTGGEDNNREEDKYVGLLLIGDPHLEGRQPGFRKDDYPRVILDKLAWCLDYARAERLLPAILGDLFDKPRDNPNWMLVRLLEMLDREVIGLYGNHDCADPVLNDNDSLSLLITSGRLRLLSPQSPWRGTISGREVIVGGSSYREPLPKRFEVETQAGAGSAAPPLVVWLAHHDILIPGYDEGRIRPHEIPGVDLLVNGHIHRALVDVPAGRTLWLTPGNISRRSRNDATRTHVPSVLRVDVLADAHEIRRIEVPHQPFDAVFHEAVVEAEVDRSQSAFVAGLAELQLRKTSAGAGLMEFLNQNLDQFEPPVADEIRFLAMEVTQHGTP